MKRRAAGYLIASAVLLLVFGAIAKHTFNAVKEKRIIRARYEAFAVTVQARNLHSARQLMTPNHLNGLDEEFRVLPNFAAPLSDRYWIDLRGDRAVICPVAQYHYGFIRGGHTLEMLKVDGLWYATGDVHVD